MLTHCCPVSETDGDDSCGLMDEVIPGLAAGGENGVVVVKDTIGEPCLAQVLPNVFGWIEFGGFGRQREDGDVGRRFEFVGGVPCGLIEEDDSVGAGRHGAADLGEMQGHGFGIGARQDQGRAFAALGTDAAEQVVRPEKWAKRLSWRCDARPTKYPVLR